MGINGGRNLRGIENMSGYNDYHVSLPNDLVERLEKYMTEEDRNRSWCIQKALDEWLKKKGY
jgi:metal-responsive CopG/Arc/MetJ family transcriptional regulator